LSSKQKEGQLVRIPPLEILQNRENPRLIFDQSDIAFLKKSIDEVGILVPLTVYRRASDQRYVLLDGERRWQCAKELNHKEVPCNVVEEPTQITNILYMFNIHNTRKEWELVPTALKLQTVIRLLGDKPNSELARLTSMTPIRVEDCKRVLKFPKRYLDLAIIPPKKERITGDFFSQMDRFLDEVERFPSVIKRFTRDKITEIMIEKYRAKTVKILEFRIMRRALADARRRGVSEEQVLKRTADYFKSEVMSPSSYYDSVTGSVYGLDKLARNAAKLRLSIDNLDASMIRKERELLQNLKELRESINKILKE
jgi:ParB family transcriptional regulator, chromosome partitioning protein